MGPHIRHCRTALVAALASVLLTPIPALANGASSPRTPTGDATRRVPAGSAGHRTLADTPGPGPLAVAPCHSARDPERAARLSRDIRAVVSSRHGTVSVAVADASGLTCAYASELRYDSASVAKVLIMEGVLRRADELRRRLTSWEAANIRPMIVSSDNTAAGRLWAALGHSYLNRFLTRTRTRATVLGPGRYWGLTRTTAADQLRLLGVLTNPSSFLRSRAYGLKLLSEVRRDQRWGVPAGMPSGLTAHVKNGWLPRATHGWRVHSVGAFTGQGRSTYRIVVLSHDNPTMAYGVGTIERIAQAVHRGLDQGRDGGPTDDALTPESEISEESDGSAPYDPLPGWDEPEPDATP
ncbi:serine hydrolase [Streptomyces montanus]|uniref:serine hydrolase n=1 Tax=Streptomyces montanus TaxID=2580423 RepID=UPI001486DCB8|nr:serine hydrolase [Streptomyces montanus]